MGSIRLRYVGKKTERDNLASISNNWLTMDERKKPKRYQKMEAIPSARKILKD